MVTCAVANCKNASGKISKDKNGITFHRFPQNKERRRQWEVAVNREETWSSSASSAVCSQHFEAKDFYLTENGLRRLSLQAVPLINISVCQEPAPSISDVEPDINPDDTEEVIQLKRRVHRLEVLAADRKRRLNMIWQSRKRYQKKVARMKIMIKHLIQNKNDMEKKELDNKLRIDDTDLLSDSLIELPFDDLFEG